MSPTLVEELRGVREAWHDFRRHLAEAIWPCDRLHDGWDEDQWDEPDYGPPMCTWLRASTGGAQVAPAKRCTLEAHGDDVEHDWVDDDTMEAYNVFIPAGGGGPFTIMGLRKTAKQREIDAAFEADMRFVQPLRRVDGVDW